LPAIGAWGQQYTISTIAGNQALGAGFTGDQGPATSAQLNTPVAVAVDSKGNIFVADTDNQVIRQISGGTITTVAGDNIPGYLGDVGTTSPEVPTSAELHDPSGVVIDSAGNIYIADTTTNVVRKVSGTQISLYAGTANTSGYGCDACPATTSYLNKPLGLALDAAGNLYIADAGNNVVRVVNASGYITTLNEGWVTAPPFLQPTGVAADPTGQFVYIADLGDQVVWRFNLANQTMTIFAGILGENGFSGDSGPAASARLNDPAGVATDAAGNVYIADTVNSVIRMVTPNGIINTIAGRLVSGQPYPGYSGDGGPATSARLNAPKSVFSASGNVYITDGNNDVIRMLQPTYPAIETGGVGNGFSYKPQLSPGAAAVIYGTGFAAAPATSGVPLQTVLGGVSVTVNGETAPLYYVSPGQINFQVPWDAQPGAGSVVVTVNAGGSNTVTVPIVEVATGLYSSVQNYPAYTINSSSNPVAAGGTIIAYATGSGPVSSTQTSGTGAPSSPLVTVTSTCIATLGTTEVTPTFCGLTPNSVGLVQVNVPVPGGLTTGTYPLTVGINGQVSNAANVSVK
jgi:uncharacterized protein (TIGR03437 family)